MLRRGSNVFHSLKKSLFLYSTSVVSSNNGITNPLMVELLVKSIGFSEEEAASIVNKVSRPLKCTENSELVVDFLRESGFDGAQIRKAVASFPDVLRSNVDKTLKPKFRAFQDVGFSSSNLASFICRNPDILGRSVESSIVPVIGVLKSVLGSNEHLVSFMLQLKSPRLFSSPKSLSDNMLLLQSYGVTSERIKWLMVNNGIFFSKKQFAEKIVKRVEEKLGIPRTSAMFIYGIQALTSKSEENIQSWLELFSSFGWSETDISALLKKHPLTLSQSEKSLRVKLKYFMEDLGLGSDYLASRPSLLTLSMEKRTLPRVAVRQTLMDRNLLKRKNSLSCFLKMAESKFMPKYVLPYKEKLPQLYENYIQATGSSLVLS